MMRIMTTSVIKNDAHDGTVMTMSMVSRRTIYVAIKIIALMINNMATAPLGGRASKQHLLQSAKGSNVQNWGSVLIFWYCRLKGRGETARSCHYSRIPYFAFYKVRLMRYDAILKGITM